MDDKIRTELEAATFRALVEHLRERTDVQNIDLMNLAGFCRNCLSKWYRAAAEEKGVALSDPEAREIVYGMPYDGCARLSSGSSGSRKKSARWPPTSRRSMPRPRATASTRRSCAS
jgi:hypothetical protein